MTAHRRVFMLVKAAGLGLLLARLTREAMPGSTSIMLVPVAVIAGLALGIGSHAILRRARVVTWPLALGWTYALWPAPAPDLGLMAALAIALLVYIQSISAPSRLWPEALVALLFGALYIGTLAPTVLPADAGEFQVVIPLLGIAHPPGYPLYTLLGRLVALLPVGDMAYRANLYAALTSAITLALVVRCVRSLSGSAWAGIAAAAALGLSPTFWVQSTTANIRSLTALFTALCLWLAMRWRERPTAGRLAALGLALGLAIGHHSSLALVALPVGVAVLVHEPRLILAPRRWLGALGAFLGSFAVLAYLPIRSAMHPAFDPAPIRTWGDFAAHVLATGFRGDMLYFRTLPLLWERARVMGEILLLEFGPWLLGAMALAAGWMLWRKRWVGGLLLAVFAINALSALTYRAPQTVEYLIPAYVALAVLLGVGLGALRGLSVSRSGRGALGRLRPDVRPPFFGERTLPENVHVGAQSSRGQTLAEDVRVAALQPAPTGIANASSTAPGETSSDPADPGNLVYSALLTAVLLATGSQGARSLPSLVQMSRDRSAREAAESLLSAAPEGALILSNWHQATPLWYLQRVEGWRPDVDVRYVYPQGARSNEEVWIERIAEQIGQRPVVITNRYPVFASTPYRWIPLADGWLAQIEPLTQAPAGLTPRIAAVGESVELLGYALDTDIAASGQELAVRVAWRAAGPVERGLSSFVQLLGPGGVLGQADLTQTGDPPALGEVRVDTYRFPLLVQTPPGDYRLVTGFYRATATGWERLATPEGDLVTLTQVTVQVSSVRPASLHPAHLPWQDGLALVGWDVDRSVTGWTRLYLHWRGAGQGAATTMLATLGEDGPLAQTVLTTPPRGGYATTVLDLPDGVARLRLARSDAMGQAILPLNAWHLPRRSGPWLRLPAGEVCYIPLGGQMALTSARLRRSSDGASALVEVEFLALQPLHWDDTVSVGLAGMGWERKTDGTPALGAIPTLKWLTGWRVHDRKRVVLDEAWRTEPAELTLTVYDAFTLQPLHVLDDRLVRAGQGTILRLGILP